MPYMKLKHIVPGFLCTSTIAISTFFLVSPSYALSAPITWTFSDIKFSDGTSASGSFTYDANSFGSGSSNIVTNNSGLASNFNTIYFLPQNDPSNPLSLFVLQLYNSGDTSKGIQINFGTTFSAFAANVDAIKDANGQPVAERAYSIPSSSNSTFLTYLANGTSYNQASYITGSVYTVIGVPFQVPGGATIPVVGGILALSAMRGIKKKMTLNNPIASFVNQKSL